MSHRSLTTRADGGTGVDAPSARAWLTIARQSHTQKGSDMVIDLIEPIEYLVKLIAWGLLRGQLPPA